MTYPTENYLFPENLLQDVMNAVVGVYEQSGVDLPTQRIYGIEAVPHDCASVAVIFNSLSKGLPGEEGGVQRCDSPRTVNLSVQVVRCWPTARDVRIQHTIQPQQQEAVFQAAQDSWLLMDAAEQVDNVRNSCGIIAGSSVFSPDGGFFSTVLDLTIVV